MEKQNPTARKRQQGYVESKKSLSQKEEFDGSTTKDCSAAASYQPWRHTFLDTHFLKINQHQIALVWSTKSHPLS
jgi:hypothetical protein